MNSYKFYTSIFGAKFITRSDGANIPLDIKNRDCAQFLADWQNGASVKNADGSDAAYSDAAATALGLI